MDDLEKVQAEIAELQRKAADLTAKKRPGIIEDIKAKMLAYGITAQDLSSAKRGTTKVSSMAGSVVPTKYKHGDLTWSGRGRQPKFVQDYISSGGKLEDLSV